MKRITTVIAAVAATLLLIATTYAEQSSAGVTFASGGTAGPGEEGENPMITLNKDLYFGAHEISPTDETYLSINREETGVGKTVGYAVNNPTGSTTYAYEVEVKVSEFLVDMDIITMAGFRLQLIPVSGQAVAGENTPTENNQAPTVNTVTLESGEADLILQSAPGQARGNWGAEWTGSLFVVGNSAHTGEATAIMDWTFRNA